MSTKAVHSFKIIASKGSRIVFDERVEAETPREAREKMKTALGLESLSGIVYAITEIPLEIIAEIVIRQMARVTIPGENGTDLHLASLIERAVAQVYESRIRELERRLEALESGSRAATAESPAQSAEFLEDTAIPCEPVEPPTEPQATQQPDLSPALTGPDWDAIKAEYLRTRSIKQTAAMFGISPNTLKARVQRGGWGR